MTEVRGVAEVDPRRPGLEPRPSRQLRPGLHFIENPFLAKKNRTKSFRPIFAYVVM
jgi:hypothetical protein